MPGWEPYADNWREHLGESILRTIELTGDFRSPEVGEWYIWRPEPQNQYAEVMYAGGLTPVGPHPICVPRTDIVPAGESPAPGIPPGNPPEGTFAGVWYQGSLYFWLKPEQASKFQKQLTKMLVKHDS